MSNKLNKPGHYALGFAAAHVPGLAWFIGQREINQLPPENDDNLVIYVENVSHNKGQVIEARVGQRVLKFTKAYYSAVRVLDSLTDIRECMIGLEVGRVFAIAECVLLGYWLAGGFA